MKEANEGYVYAYLEPCTGKCTYGEYTFDNTPYYIGLSRVNVNRKYSHFYEAINSTYSGLKENKIRKLVRLYGKDKVLNNIVVVKDNLSDEEVSKLEIDLIKLIGRRDLNNGPLTNHTDGGDGAVVLSKAASMIRGHKIIDTRSKRSCYSYNPEHTKQAISETMTEWFAQNRNKQYSDLPELKFRRYYSKTLHGRSGSRSATAKYYYLVITEHDGGYHLASKGCMKYLAEKLGISPTTVECSARENERRIDEKFTRIMRGAGYGSYAFRFEKLSDCPVDITIGNQHPRPMLP